MKLNRTLFMVGLTIVLPVLASCSAGNALVGRRVDPGYVALLVNNYGDESQRGIDNAEIFTGGRVTFNDITHDLYEYPVFFQTYKFEGEQSVSFSMSGSKASMDIGVTYQFKYTAIDESNPNYTHLHNFFRQYRVDPETFNAGTMRNALRDCANEAASGTNPVEIATNPVMFQKPLTECLVAKFPDIEIKEISLLNPPVLPENIQASIDRSFQAKQDAETAIANAQKAEAEGRANVAVATANARVRQVEAQSEADANRLLAQSITPALLDRERLEIERIRAEKWNGQMSPTIQTPNVQLGTQSETVPAQ